MELGLGEGPAPARDRKDPRRCGRLALVRALLLRGGLLILLLLLALLVFVVRVARFDEEFLSPLVLRVLRLDFRPALREAQESECADRLTTFRGYIGGYI